MIFLNQEEESVFTIDKDLVVEYKRTGDRYLVSMYHELTKQLIAYTIYNDLQKVDNYFYAIIKGLLYDEFTKLSTMQNNYSSFVRYCDVFIKNCEDVVPEESYKIVVFYVDKLKLLMQKLVYIAENICYDLEDT